ncbi:MAG: tetratricopeptide repeat protein [Puniceicoccales bacterium]|jgi:outer membrane protein assembly factor BamD|nr:tetratricopeptide repeat protein [Puniceicoccales bacterium]
MPARNFTARRTIAPGVLATTALTLLSGCGTTGVPPPAVGTEVLAARIQVENQKANGLVTTALAAKRPMASESHAGASQPSNRQRVLFSLVWDAKAGYTIHPKTTLSGRNLSTHAMRANALANLTQARRSQLAGNNSSALSDYETLAFDHAGSDIAAESLFQSGIIHAKRSELREAFDAFDKLTRSHPDFDRFDNAVAWQYQIALAAKTGHRPYLWGVIPWFTDPVAAVGWFEKVSRTAPFGALAAQAIFDKGTLALERGQTDEALDAFDRVIWDYPHSPLVPEAWLALARTRETDIPGHDIEPAPDGVATDPTGKTAPATGGSTPPAPSRSKDAALKNDLENNHKITGHEWDQGATRDALAYYNEFIRRYPKHPKVGYAVRNAARMREILARNRYDLGLFYFEHRNNPRAAALFFHEAINIAPESAVARESNKRIADILKGDRAPSGTMDWLFGRYPQYKDTSYNIPPPAPDTSTLGFRSLP